MAPDAGYLSLLPSPTGWLVVRAPRVYVYYICICIYIYTLISTRAYINTYMHAHPWCVHTTHGENIRVSIYAYIRTISPAVPHRCIHSIMLSGETRLSRILKGFNNIWKLLPKSWRSSSSLRYVLGATLGIRPIHLPSPLRRAVVSPKVLGACGYREEKTPGTRGEDPSSPSLPPSRSAHKLSLGGYDTRSGGFNFSA